MYIYDCLYGKIEFDDIIYKCMLTPEMQRLREVRLGNINSLFLMGSANCNRFEHSVGTAFLAKINYEENTEKPKKKEKNDFILAALFHDLANGPFGHSYEYLQEKKGFVPEENVGSVINCSKEGIYKKGASLEPIFFGQYNQIMGVLKEDDINEIDEIISGNNSKFSKLISDVIDLDNIDNVFRMAYHMGIEFDKNTPIKLAQNMLCKDGTIYFREDAYPYLYEWHKTRKRLYKMLLYNPQDFAAKCMLTELIDVVLEYDPKRIQWYFTDYDLLMALKDIGEIWVQESVEIESEVEFCFDTIIEDKEKIEVVIESVLGVNISKNLCYEIDECNRKIRFTINNTHYVIKNGKIYKMKRNTINVTNIVSRLMTGDLYYCLSIFSTRKTEFYNRFMQRKERKKLEEECNRCISNEIEKNDVNIMFHVILDKNKTDRQLDINYLSGEEVIIGDKSNNLLIGVFVKTPKYGLASGKKISVRRRREIENIIDCFFKQIGIEDIELIKMYDEVNCLE